MNILVTGASGFIGSNLIKKLVDDGHKLFCISHSAISTNDRLKNYIGNFQDKEILNEILPKIELVIHLACSSVPENSILFPDQDIQNNVLGSLELLTQMKNHNVKKIIYVSSGGVVYGNAEVIPTPESEKLKPISSYGITKMLVERNIVLLAENLNIDYCVLRISNAYGSGQHQRKNQGIINIWMNNIKNDLPIKLIEDGQQVRDYIHIGDIINAFSSVIENQITGVYNISTGIGTSLNQLKEKIETIVGKKAKIESISNRGFDVNLNCLSNEKFSEISNWSAQITLDNGLKLL